MNAVVSLDCEANGLHGQIFAVAAALYVDGGERATVVARCPIDGPVEPWVAENVLPAIAEVPVDVGSGEDLLAAWREFFAAARVEHPDVLVIAHVAWPVEARFLWDAHRDVPFSGPFPLVDVAPMLLQAGYDPLSVDGYLAAHGIPAPVGSPHHPLYDCRAAASAYRALTDPR